MGRPKKFSHFSQAVWPVKKTYMYINLNKHERVQIALLYNYYIMQDIQFWDINIRLLSISWII